MAAKVGSVEAEVDMEAEVGVEAGRAPPWRQRAGTAQAAAARPRAVRRSAPRGAAGMRAGVCGSGPRSGRGPALWPRAAPPSASRAPGRRSRWRWRRRRVGGGGGGGVGGEGGGGGGGGGSESSGGTGDSPLACSPPSGPSASSDASAHRGVGGCAASSSRATASYSGVRLLPASCPGIRPERVSNRWGGVQHAARVRGVSPQSAGLQDGKRLVGRRGGVRAQQLEQQRRRRTVLAREVERPAPGPHRPNA